MSVLIETRLAEYINTVANCKRVKLAADKLGVRYQTIAQSISRLEQSMGIKDLFLNQGGLLEANPEYEEIFNICYQMVSLDKQARDIATNKLFHDFMSFYSTQTLNEAFFVPFYLNWMNKNPKIILKLKEDDNFSMHSPKYNEISTVIKVLDDQNKFKYFPFHNFRQKLWASESFIKKHGPFNEIKDLREKIFLLQKVSTQHATIATPDKEVLGYRGIINNLIANQDLAIQILDIDGVRTIDILCEEGVGIMPAAMEPLKLMGKKLINILPNLSGDDICVHIKVRKDSFEKSKATQNLIRFIFECRDAQFKKINVTPSYAAPKI